MKSINSHFHQHLVKNLTCIHRHIHADDEVRYFVNGSGYFDVRDQNDCWIRIHAQAGDLLILPAGIYHRFVTDVNNYSLVTRVFKDDPKWTPVNRSTDCETHPIRVEYLKSIKSLSCEE